MTLRVNSRTQNWEGSKTPLSYFPADMEGVEPSSSLLMEMRAPFYMSCDSFLVYQLGESSQGRTDALVLVLTQLFHRLRSMTVIWRVRLLLALVEGIFCPLSERPSLLGELFQLVTIVRAKLSPGQTLLDSGFSLLRSPCVKHGYHPF